MYDYIIGKIVSKNDSKIVLENNGIGYELLCNSRTIQAIEDDSLDVKIYTKLIHKEDTMFLCGFRVKEEKIIFDILTSVNGIGTKMALTLLDEFTLDEFISAVTKEDYKLISRAKGVGLKLAQKIVLELKDKLTTTKTTLNLVASDVKNKKISDDTIIEVQTILESLGWSANEYKDAIKISIDLIDKDDSEELLKESLRILSSK